MEEKGDRQEVASFLRFIAKLQRKLLRNQLNYKQNIFIIKKIIVFSLETNTFITVTQMEEFSTDPQSMS